MILFGEHAAVYGHKVIACGINSRTFLYMESRPLENESCSSYTFKFPDIGNGIFSFTTTQLQHIASAPTRSSVNELLPSINDNRIIDTLLVFCLLDSLVRRGIAPGNSSFSTNPPHWFNIRVTSDIPIGAGLGSSAALCLTMAACQLLIHKQFRPEDVPECARIQSLAHEAEHILHTKPSGVDTAVCALGKVLTFGRDVKTGEVFKSTLDLGSSTSWRPEILIVDTRVPRSCTDAVQAVAAFRAAHPEVCNTIMLDIGSLVGEAEILLTSSDLESPSTQLQLNELFAKNHELLRQLGVSHPKLEAVRKALEEELGIKAKLTGAGCGGCLIAFPVSAIDQQRVSLERVRGILEPLDVTATFAKMIVDGCSIAHV